MRTSVNLTKKRGYVFSFLFKLYRKSYTLFPSVDCESRENFRSQQVHDVILGGIYICLINVQIISINKARFV